ncbi:MAG: TlpA family protein disulfide reductase [Nitrospiraceae bacterium]|nr:TlpA family protein disulfide reductase [Nitrospiraceae bacterium]
MKTLAIIIFFIFTASTASALSVNDNAPLFSLRDSDGKFFYLSNYIGSNRNSSSKGVIINFFASTCIPCKKELPILNSIVDEFRKKGIEIVIIGYKEDFNKIGEMLNALSVDKPVILSDIYGKVGEKYGVIGLPLTLIINKDGKVKEIIWGERANIDKILREKTGRLLK